MNWVKYILLVAGLLTFQLNQAQTVSFSAGSDIPYQHYIGVNGEVDRFALSYRTGILLPPYSDAILALLETIGTDELLVDLLEVAYQRGWMNGLGAYVKFGTQRRCFAGLEFRYDVLSAKAVPIDLIETIMERNIIAPGPRQINAEMQLRSYADGVRFGRLFCLDA